MAHLARPDNSFDEVVLSPQGGRVYKASYADTHVEGNYSFTVSARGDGFERCQAAASFSVRENAPSEPTVGLEPAALRIPECAAGEKSRLKVTGVSDLIAFSFRLRFDPGVIKVADANPGVEGTQITLGQTFYNKQHFIAKNEVDNNAGLINFAVTLIGEVPINGDPVLVEIEWAPRQLGSGGLVFDELALVNPQGVKIEAQTQNSSIEVVACNDVSGQVYLQGRDSHAGATITTNQGEQTQTESDGSFSIARSETLIVKFAGYLSARANVPARLAELNAAGEVEAASLGAITLLAGDVNGDDIIDIFDLAYMANRYRSEDSTADLNADGTVNILDLAIAANNYRQQGPLTEWQ
jgi:hypothetical protein